MFKYRALVTWVTVMDTCIRCTWNLNEKRKFVNVVVNTVPKLLLGFYSIIILFCVM